MLTDHQECTALVTAVARVGCLVDADGRQGFVDRTKHPSWWSDAPRPEVGDRLRVAALDAGRTPVRLSALPDDLRTARALRHTGPLERLCPPPPPGAVTGGVEWAAVEEALGTALPADYKRLVRSYGCGLFAGTLRLLTPGHPDPCHDLPTQAREREEILRRLRESGEDRPPELLTPGVRLVPWGFDEGAGHFPYRVVRPGVEPEEWTVVLNEGRGPLWEAAPVSCSRYLHDVVAGTSTSFHFGDLDEVVDPGDRARFVSYAEAFGDDRGASAP
ncbi:SMI1/KNR4 family protein [Streptomyces sp. NPDC058664]|uniref:SMI1/KNR4 family protein n=1 Tax=unclassified Streptomyces TaxID=2593676 RepID=UPI00364850C2